MLIGFMGTMTSGKDTCADYLVRNYSFQKKAFADPLKKICEELFFFTDEQLYGTQKKIPDCSWFNCTPRTALQFVGTDLLRNNLDKIMPGLKNNIFTHHFKLWFENEVKDPNYRIAVSDVRFQNEADYIKDLGGIIVKVNRPNLPDHDLHESEIELQKIPYDYLIENIGTKNDLYKNLDTVLSHWRSVHK
jgi:hypothetical protein